MKASIYVGISLDGYIAREDGGLDWLEGSDEEAASDSGKEDYGYDSFMGSIDVLIFGRITFEQVLSFGKWPYGTKRVIVLSSTLTKLPDDLPDSVELRNSSPAELMSELEQSGAKNLYVDGGKTIQGFLNADLIDEIIITKIPILIGNGIPLFGPLTDDIKLRHIETHSFENGFVQSKYEVIK